MNIFVVSNKLDRVVDTLQFLNQVDSRAHYSYKDEKIKLADNIYWFREPKQINAENLIGILLDGFVVMPSCKKAMTQEMYSFLLSRIR